MAAKITAGQMVGGYQVQAQAPLDYIKGRQREQGGRYVRGAWSDPWWGYDPARGWAVVKVWRQREQVTVDWRPGAVRGELVTIPAAEEIVAEAVEPAAA
jgi:hypothetical protein